MCATFGVLLTVSEVTLSRGRENVEFHGPLLELLDSMKFGQSPILDEYFLSIDSYKSQDLVLDPTILKMCR